MNLSFSALISALSRATVSDELDPFEPLEPLDVFRPGLTWLAEPGLTWLAELALLGLGVGDLVVLVAEKRTTEEPALWWPLEAGVMGRGEDSRGLEVGSVDLEGGRGGRPAFSSDGPGK